MFVIFMFGFGALVTNLFTDIGKVTVGGLRPYFLTVCKPNVTLANCSQGFVTGDVCTGNPKDILEARSVTWIRITHYDAKILPGFLSVKDRSHLINQ